MKATINLEAKTYQDMAVLLRGLAGMFEGGLVMSVSAEAKEGTVDVKVTK